AQHGGLSPDHRLLHARQPKARRRRQHLQAFDMKQRNGQNYSNSRALQQKRSQFGPAGTMADLRRRFEKALGEHWRPPSLPLWDDIKTDTVAANFASHLGNKKAARDERP